ncbi:MAG TPA: FG-GAP-like repeat-containing protein, partial [Bacteroidota bacterium]|nr:FG-GAP-like repeat-containing protein [Bacteroidota bacterium]
MEKKNYNRVGIGKGLLWAYLFYAQYSFGQPFTKLPATGLPMLTDPAGPNYSGVSWIDYDNDGRTDLLTNGKRIYRNLGNGQFATVTPGFTGGGSQIGQSCADFNNDGRIDFYFAGGSGSGSVLYRNDGGGTFTLITSGDIGMSTTNLGFGCAWGDYDNDGYLDLVIAAAYGFAGINTPNRLFHNNGNGTFSRIDSSVITSGLADYTVPSWSDFDQDGDMDAFIAAGPITSLGPDYFYRNLLKETDSAYFEFLDAAPLTTENRNGQIINWIDYDNDGDLDCYITNYGNKANDLYRNNDTAFVKMTFSEVGTIVSDVASSLSSVWEDFDNNGTLDCFVTNDGTTRPNRLYFNNGNGTFTSYMTGTLVTEVGPHRGAAAADYDDDGDVDLFISAPSGTRGFYRNDVSNGKHWIFIGCIGIQSNRSAIGAKIRVKATIQGTPVWQLREVSSQNSFDSQNDLRVHFGLGDATAIDSLTIEWPSGAGESYSNVQANQNLTIVENDSTPVSLVFPPDAATNTVPTPALRWNQDNAGAPYQVQVSTDSTFATGLIVNDSTVTDTGMTFNVLTNNSTYYWRVRSFRSIHKTVWSVTRRFTNTITPPAAPALDAPSTGAVHQAISPVLRWRSVQAATSYRLQLSADSSFTTVVVDDSSLVDTLRQVNALLNDTKYFWHVRATNIGGSSSFSDTRSFTTIIDTPASPQLLSPGDGSTDLPTSLTVSWTRPASADSFRLQISTDSAFATNVLASTDTTTTREIGPLSHLTRYFWRVNASNIGGTSPYSLVRSFTTIIGTPPLLLPPDGGTEPVLATLRWSKVTGASMYQVVLS